MAEASNVGGSLRRGRSAGLPGTAEALEHRRKERRTREMPAANGEVSTDDLLRLLKRIAALEGTIDLQDEAAAVASANNKANTARLHDLIDMHQQGLLEMKGRARESGEHTRKLRGFNCTLTIKANEDKEKIAELAKRIEDLDAQSAEQESAIRALQGEATSFAGPRVKEKGDVEAHRKFLTTCDLDTVFDEDGTAYCDLVDGMTKEGMARQGEHKSVTALRNAALLTRAVYLMAKKDFEWRERWGDAMKRRRNLEERRDKLKNLHQRSQSLVQTLRDNNEELAAEIARAREMNNAKDLAVIELAKAVAGSRAHHAVLTLAECADP